MFSQTRAFQNKKVSGKRHCSYHRERGRRVADLTKQLKMKFVEGSEKCPDKTAKLDAPEDNRDTEGSSMIWALFCYFQKKIRGQWIIVLWPGDVYIPVQVSAHLDSFVFALRSSWSSPCWCVLLQNHSVWASQILSAQRASNRPKTSQP